MSEQASEEYAAFWGGGGAEYRGLPINASSKAHAASLFAKSGQGRLWGFTVYNSNAAAQFILLFDLTWTGVVPANGTAADCVFRVSGTSHLPINYIPARWHQQGIILCNSSTEPTLTIGAADCTWDVQYE